MPLYTQSVLEASPLRSGVLLMPLIVITATCGVLVGIFIHRTGRYLELIWVGTVMITVGNGLFVDLSATSSVAKLLGYQVVEGIGSGLLFEPPLIALQSHISNQNDIAAATSTLSFCRSMALAISIIVGGVVFQNSMDNQASNLRASGLPSNITSLLSGTNAGANAMIAQKISDPAQKLAVKKAFAYSMRNMWIMYCCFGACSILASIFVKRRALSKEHQETVTGIKKMQPPANEALIEVPLTVQRQNST